MTRIVTQRDELARRVAEGLEIEVAELHASIGEMITTADGLMDLVQKVRVDVEFGQAETPTLYESLYRRVNGPFPGKVVDIGENTLQANVVFFEKLEGGEVQFGVMQKGVPKSGRLRTWAAGFKWTEDMEEWDNTWQFEMVNQAFGRSYNHFLNHIHFSAITLYDHNGDGTPSYPSANLTAADTTADTSIQFRTLETFRKAAQHSLQASPLRPWSILLANEIDRWQIEGALLDPVADENNNLRPRVPVDTIIYYNGADIEMGTELYQYPAVTQGKVFCIFPRQRMLELVHHDLRIDADNRDITRLIQAAIVGRTRRGIYAEVENSVEVVTLPT